MKKCFLLLLLMTALMSCQTQEKKEKINLDITVKTDHGIQLGSGSIQRIDSFPSKNIVPRTVDIWLPDGYSKDKKYAVLYMHDGQMLFDANTTWNKQEWKVDEFAGQLQKEGKTKDFIVVAPHNISRIRWNDYFPAKAFDYIPKVAKDSLQSMAKKNNFDTTMNADGYLKFLTKELKPYIDQNYSVHTDKANTVVSGSSMGGLISMYAISEYPDVFGAAACISTHWPGAGVYEGNPMPEAIFAYMKEHTPPSKDHRLYFDYGTKTLDQFYPQYAETVNKIYTDNGYDSTNFVNRLFEGADHSENSWNQRLDISFIFLLGK
ncbi:MAG: alpha/beta hydrolase [Wenyingzhuangia sp.]